MSEPFAKFPGIEGPLVLVVLDGVGEIERTCGNAVALANPPFWTQLRNELRQTDRFMTIKAHGTAVGMPSDKDMGNSEVGHNALGCGQIYEQGAKLVMDAIAGGSMFRGAVWREALANVVSAHKTLHLLGLLSDGNVHSHIEHLVSMLKQSAQDGVMRVRLHVLLDGRDVGATTAHEYVARIESLLAELNTGGRDYRIASGGGRMKVTMDRYDADWAMVEAGWNLHVRGRGPLFPSALTAIETYRGASPGITDQDLPGFVIGENGGAIGTIGDGDSVLLFNFRGDRALEIARAFEDGEDFDKFDRQPRPRVFFAGMMQYDGDLLCPKHYLVGPPKITGTLTEHLVQAGLSQFAISETQKFGHVTYFWNGNRSGLTDAKLETFVEIPSDTGDFAEKPWMKCAEITTRLCSAIRAGRHKFLRVNYANGDMVGHTGDLNAAVCAIACLDLQLRRLTHTIAAMGGVALITADHGNCDEMFELDESGKPLLQADGAKKAKTSHTLSPVPMALFDPAGQVPARLARGAFGLANLAATTSQLLGLAPPARWQPSLLDWKS